MTITATQLKLFKGTATVAKVVQTIPPADDAPGIMGAFPGQHSLNVIQIRPVFIAIGSASFSLGAILHL